MNVPHRVAAENLVVDWCQISGTYVEPEDMAELIERIYRAIEKAYTEGHAEDWK